MLKKTFRLAVKNSKKYETWCFKIPFKLLSDKKAEKQYLQVAKTILGKAMVKVFKQSRSNFCRKLNSYNFFYCII